MHSRTKKILIISFFLLLLLIPVFYYRDKLQEPSKLIYLFLDASKISAFSLKFLLINFSIFISAAFIDIFSLGWDKSALRRIFIPKNKTTQGDLWCWLLSVFSLYDFFALAFSFGIFYVISSIIVHTGGFSLISLIPYVWLQIVLIFIIGDFKNYCWHRFMHLNPYWELHKYHHSATEFNLITTSRGHFLEKGFLTIFDSILFSLLGAPIEYFVFLIFVREFYSQLLHADLEWKLGWFGKYILISPLDHKLHHSQSEDHYDKNFGTLFIFWDKIFGTYAKTDEKITIGIKNNPYNINGFWKDMMDGSRTFGESAIQILRKKLFGPLKRIVKTDKI